MSLAEYVKEQEIMAEAFAAANRRRLAQEWRRENESHYAWKPDPIDMLIRDAEAAATSLMSSAVAANDRLIRQITNPDLVVELLSSQVDVRTRHLKANWSIEAQQDYDIVNGQTVPYRPRTNR